MNKKERKSFDRVKGMHSPLPKNWRQGASPKSTNRCHGWVAEMDRGYTDGSFAVLVRTVETEEYGQKNKESKMNYLGKNVKL